MAEGLGSQLKRLRVECGLLVEELAAVLQVDPRAVYKHLSDKSVPRRSHLAAYEKLFSEKLSRPVTLKFIRKVKVHATVQ